MKIAIVQDGLMCKAGGEQVALSFHKAFPSAPIFTLAYDRNNTFEEFKNAKVITSWLQNISYHDSVVKRLFFPLGLLAASTLDVRDFDVVLMSTTHCAKYVRTSSKAVVICYAHNPFRLAWYPQEYEQIRNAKGLKRSLFLFLTKILCKIDKKSIEKVNTLLTNSYNVKARLLSIYDNYNGDPIKVVHPPVNFQNFYISKTKSKYFLVVSRLEAYKRVDLVIDAFNSLKLPLVIVGKGECEDELKKLVVGDNITFLKDLNNLELASVYSKARAFIFPQIEDFGITALEANASGLPVIALGKGGALETQVNYDPLNDTLHGPTAIFFNEQAVDLLIKAVNYFLQVEAVFDPLKIRQNAKRFEEEDFIKRIQSIVTKKAHSI